MGGGEIKMMAMFRSLHGVEMNFSTTFIGSLTGFVVGIFLMITKKRAENRRYPSVLSLPSAQW